MSVFCMPGRVGVVPVAVLRWRRWCSGRLLGRAPWCARGRRPAHGHWAGLLVAPRVFRTPEAPAAREARRPHFVRHRASKPAHALRTLRRPPHRRRFGAVNSLAGPRHRPRAPQPGPLAPSGPSGALHAGGAWLLMCGLVRRFEARRGPAAAHGHRSQVLLRPPVPPAPSTTDCCRSPVWPVTHVKPSSPLLACALSPVKPTTPLQAGYTRFCCYVIEQRRRGFHTGVLRFPHWC